MILVQLDVSGSTRLSAQMDPEKYADLMAGFINNSIRAVVLSSGRVDSMTGDGIIASFTSAYDVSIFFNKITSNSKDLESRIYNEYRISPIQGKSLLKIKAVVNNTDMSCVKKRLINIQSGLNTLFGYDVSIMSKVDKLINPFEVALIGEDTYRLFDLNSVKVLRSGSAGYKNTSFKVVTFATLKIFASSGHSTPGMLR